MNLLVEASSALRRYGTIIGSSGRTMARNWWSRQSQFKRLSYGVIGGYGAMLLGSRAIRRTTDVFPGRTPGHVQDAYRIIEDERKKYNDYSDFGSPVNTASVVHRGESALRANRVINMPRTTGIVQHAHRIRSGHTASGSARTNVHMKNLFRVG